MTDNEIIKALECCEWHECADCPLRGEDCANRIITLALSLIHHQKAEIDSLRINMYAYSKERTDNIIREFANRLKKKHGTIFPFTRQVSLDDIDSLVEEMVGDDNGC